MDAFFQTMGGVSALVLGIVVLSIFFWALGRLNRFLDGKKTACLPGLGPNSALVDVHVLGGTVFEKVKVLGLSEGPSKGLPHQLSRMLVLQDSKGLKTYIKSDSIRMIQELSTN